MQIAIKPVIIAGGSGARLWPLSNASYPKQFIQTLDGLSSFQLTLLRHRILGEPTVIINKEHVDVAACQIAEIDLKATFVIEPEQKNTAACAVLGALFAQNAGCDSVLLLPSDHNIVDEALYLRTLFRGFEHLKHNVVTVGIKPTCIHTGYGYIRVGSAITQGIYDVEQFVEKPNLVTASNYIRHGGYFWNSGIFMYGAEYLLEQMRFSHMSSYENICASFDMARNDATGTWLHHESYSKIESISVDYAIMEHVVDMKLIEGNFGWSDIGSWDSLWRVKVKDELSNYLEGNILAHNVTNSYVVAGKKQMVVVGLDSVAVIDTDDAILVTDKSSSEDVKIVVQRLQALQRLQDVRRCRQEWVDAQLVIT